MSNLELSLFKQLLLDKKLREKPLSNDEIFFNHYITYHSDEDFRRTRPDLTFRHARVAVYVDGPHHQKKIHNDRDKRVNDSLIREHWHVIRIPHPGVLNKKEKEYVLLRIRASVNHRVPYVEVIER